MIESKRSLVRQSPREVKIDLVVLQSGDSGKKKKLPEKKIEKVRKTPTIIKSNKENKPSKLEIIN